MRLYISVYVCIFTVEFQFEHNDRRISPIDSRAIKRRRGEVVLKSLNCEYEICMLRGT